MNCPGMTLLRLAPKFSVALSLQKLAFMQVYRECLRTSSPSAHAALSTSIAKRKQKSSKPGSSKAKGKELKQKLQQSKPKQQGENSDEDVLRSLEDDCFTEITVVKPAASVKRTISSGKIKKSVITSQKSENRQHLQNDKSMGPNLKRVASSISSTSTTQPLNHSTTSTTDNVPADVSQLDSLLLFPFFKPSNPDVPTFQPVTYIDLPENLTSHTPAVTTVLKDTMSPENRYFLKRWEKEMIGELGFEGFQRLKQETFQKGHNLHSCIQRYLQGKKETLLPSVEGYWASIAGVIPEISDVHFIEHAVSHPYLQYKGIVDCVARYRQQLCVIDWKTSKKQKSDIKYTYDNPLQLAAYTGAVNFGDSLGEQIEHTLLVIAYEDGQPAHAHLLPRSQCIPYWGQWLQRLHLYWRRRVIESIAPVS